VTIVLLIAGAFAGVIAGKAWDWAGRYLTTTRPAGKLWGWLADAEPVRIVMSTGLPNDSEYTGSVFPTEAQAAAEIKSYLESTLSHKASQRLSDGLGENVKDDLILIGGPVANEVSRQVLARSEVPFRFDGHTIIQATTGDRWRAKVRTSNGQATVLTDYCLIVRTRNPFNVNRGVLLIGGSRTYGTLAGARAMLRNGATEMLNQTKGLGRHYVAIIETQVHNHVPGEPRIIQCWPLATGRANEPTAIPTAMRSS
jgi:hypothetical protein